jgi:hypothetical protein
MTYSNMEINDLWTNTKVDIKLQPFEIDINFQLDAYMLHRSGK